MNRNPEVETQNEGRQDGEYVVRLSRLSDIIAILVCAVLAVIVWVAVMNATDTDYLKLEILAPDTSMEYTLSETHLEVEGTVAVLRDADSIGISIAAYDKPGEYVINPEQLQLPDGVTLVDSNARLVLTVRQKG